MEKFKIWTEDDARRCIATPKSTDDKYSRGVLGVIAGSRQYPGAAVLACEGAMQTGVGMVRYSGPRIARMLVLRQSPEVVIQSGQVQAWLIGPGIDFHRIGRRKRRFIENALDQKVPLILDAGAISLTLRATTPTLITPHFRELSSLFALSNVEVSATEIQGAPKKWALLAANKFNVSVLLKGTQTVVASGQTAIELPSAPAWLATAGTGDVLSGILGALLATQSDLIKARPEFLAELAATGSWIHSHAALLASSGGPINAISVSAAIPEAIRKLLTSI
ncbi:MAG TPA: ADP/ATP-dependent (S)-NAD(P)H-hydrate dehydratase [Candidatus Paceibacterota bacterium]|nr:ADP/ATP-dependent (S)-NAD(P)H-hydrate dehydratase [Candidatus Paceibacterota bacterium]